MRPCWWINEPSFSQNLLLYFRPWTYQSGHKLIIKWFKKSHTGVKEQHHYSVFRYNIIFLWLKSLHSWKVCKNVWISRKTPEMLTKAYLQLRLLRPFVRGDYFIVTSWLLSAESHVWKVGQPRVCRLQAKGYRCEGHTSAFFSLCVAEIVLQNLKPQLFYLRLRL